VIQRASIACGQACGRRANCCGAVRHGKISPQKKLVGCLAAFVLALAGCRCAEPSGGPGDDDGDRPLRIVTLTPSATELVHAVGASDLLVGVDEFSRFPPEVATLPRVGSFMAPSLEAILRLAPDLVITDDIHAEVQAALADAGVASLTCDMHTLADVRAGILAVAERLGRPEVGQQVVAEIDQAVDAAGLRRAARGVRVLAVIDREAGGLGNLVAAGPGSWLDELLAIVGARNVLAAAGVRYPKISPEEILRGAPEVIVDASYGAAPARIAADWADAAGVPAVRAGRIAVLGEPYFLAPSPRVGRALAELEAALSAGSPPGDRATRGR
jgi:iron complex transport system substrate-binding protein